MKKEIKKWGNSLIIRFSPEEMRTHNLKEGSIIDLTDIVLKVKPLPQRFKSKLKRSGD